MEPFIIHFLICNIVISIIIGILLSAKRLLRNILSSRMQYHLWFFLLGLLAVPFIPARLSGFRNIFSWLEILKRTAPSNSEPIMGEAVGTSPMGAVNWVNDFAISVSRETSPAAGLLLTAVWMAGIGAMTILVIKSALRLHALKQSALPLQNPAVRQLYRCCLKEMNITREIPIYSTAFLKSPVMVGLFKPGIYLPIHLISDYRASDMRYMLLHELQHYKHKDTMVCYLMNLAGILYWFNPFVWYALKEMRIDKEIACDASVLNMLSEVSYRDYGNTLINFAEKVSLTPFPFSSGLGGSMEQIKRRIISIASYEKPSFRKKLKGMSAFLPMAVFLMGFIPVLSARASDDLIYQWSCPPEDISIKDFSEQFQTYTGSFVLYDSERHHWIINDMEQAVMRTSPDSTYKIYDSLFALEAGMISPENSQIPWDGTEYPFEAWNTDQTLSSAMASSVNWYFQSLDKQLGPCTLQSYIQTVKYGNENIAGDLSSYWLESTLKISPIEQVELLVSLYQNDFAFAPENIQAVKDAIRLSASDQGTLYGKTGTGRINGQDVNGWFIGFVETTDHACFFATNIKADTDATGSSAAEITTSILSELQIWE